MIYLVRIVRKTDNTFQYFNIRYIYRTAYSYANYPNFYPSEFRKEKPAITSAPREVESIDTIIDQIKQKCSSNQALIQKVEKAISSDSDSLTHSDEPPQKKIDQQPESKNLDSSIDSENYDELLDKLDEETDEDVIERVMKRYGLK